MPTDPIVQDCSNPYRLKFACAFLQALLEQLITSAPPVCGSVNTSLVQAIRGS